MSALATIRASSWPDLFDCPARWYARNIQGLRMPSSGAAALGTAVHHGAAVFDAAKISGDFITIEDASEAAADMARNPDQEVVWDDALPHGKAVDTAATLTAEYCAKIGVSRTYAAVEIECEALDVSTKYGTVCLTGTTDRIRTTDSGMGITDLKTGGQAVNAEGNAVVKGHHLQLGIYTIMAEHAIGQSLNAPAEIVGMKTKGKPAVGVGYLEDVRSPLIGTEDKPGLIEIAAQMLDTGLFPPNPKSMLCSEKYCPAYPTCPYHA